ncbi:UvrD-helicase domain-containing protein [Altererythrobacter sp. TH136]|uniref:UvrD-helicase domain-containing protein n=1 Tax=Altererythrobacter sp. TH136 TaxID=2067415 RepID=UPI001164A548|nr:UvrD-helicase domain-containing protein [Altererythrobacter sp. TH136]QDM40641.1 AAA family ATPase [Altererythrobacter sp. TH136]
MNMMSENLSDESARVAALTEHERTFLVEAGAGSGKTALMAGRLVLLLAGGAAPNSIAAVTFTELAASELLERIRDFVDDLLAGSVPAEMSAAIPDGLSLRQREALEVAAGNLDQVTCTTIHGFCQRLITPYPVEAGIDPGASLMDPGEVELMFDEAVDRWIRNALDSRSETIVSELVFQDPTKATELVWTIASALRKNRELRAPDVEPLLPKISALKEAAKGYASFVAGAQVAEPESKAAAEAFASMSREASFAETDQSAAALVRLVTLAADKSLCTAKGSFRAYQKRTKWEAAARVSGVSKTDAAELNSKAEDHHATCCARWTAMLETAASHILAGLMIELRPVAEQFQETKRISALLDFDDLIHSARRLLRDHSAVRDALSDRFKHVLVDEFQDTDPLQTEIFWRLCGDQRPGHNPLDWPEFKIRPGSLFLVGDPKQAIYRFRGADVAAYIRAREAMVSRDPKSLLAISTNFRSCASILRYVNERFASELTVEKGQPGFAPLEAYRADPVEGLCVAALPIACAGADGKAPSSVQRDCEAEAVAEMCCRLIGSQIVVDRKTQEQRLCQPGDIALLAPGGTELWRYEEALEKRGVPVATQAGKGFFQRQEVQDLIALTRVLADGSDTLAFLSLLRGPLVGLTEEQLLDILEGQPRDPAQSGARPRLSIYLNPPEIRHPVARSVLEKLQALRRRANGTTPHQLLAEAIDVLRIRPIVLQRHGGQAERPLANIDLFLSLSQPYSVRGMKAFAAAMSEAWEGKSRSVEGRPDAQEEAVSLVTMHASKGLEWPIVVPINTMTSGNNVRDPIIDSQSNRMFIPILGTGPAGYEQAKKAEVAERERERLRLWYVAATRARELLVLPKLNVRPKGSSWNALMEFDLESLPLIEIEKHQPGFAVDLDAAENHQTHEMFGEEAAFIASVTPTLRWVAPSRGEGLLGAPEGTAITLTIGPDDEQGVGAREIQGGRERGLVLHKLLEEILTAEISPDPMDLSNRAEFLLQELGQEPQDNAAVGFSPQELAETVMRTVALPEIAPLLSRLVPELPVYGYRCADEGAVAVSGIVDALLIGADGTPELVIDWKSDVSPSTADADLYGEQVKHYLEITGIPKGLVVFVTSGMVLQVSRS